MKVLIAGLAKTGTTGLLFLVSSSVGKGAKLLFEPDECPPGIDSEGGNVIAKVLIKSSLNTASFAPFDKKITIIRDPRDRIVSDLLYSQFHAGYLADERRVSMVRDCLERKEFNPSSVSIREILGVMGKADEVVDKLSIFRKSIEASLHSFDKYVAAMGDTFLYKYEDFVSREYAPLENYLGWQLTGNTEIPEALGRVVRTKNSGDWRNWFTDEDIQAYKPMLAPWLEKYGYDAEDWDLNDEPFIDSKHCSAYFTRLVEEYRERSNKPARNDSSNSPDLDALKNKGVRVLNRPNSSQPEKTVVVLGADHGASTMVADVLQALGVNLGDTLDAGLEDIELNRLVETKDFSGLQAIVARRNQEYPIWGWKLPSALKHGDLWQSKLRNPHVIVVFRDPFAIANQNRISMGTDIFQNMEDSVQQLGTLVQFLQKQKHPVLLCSYEKMLALPEIFVHAVDDFLELNAVERRSGAIRKISHVSKASLEASRITPSLSECDSTDDLVCGRDGSNSSGEIVPENKGVQVFNRTYPSQPEKTVVVLGVARGGTTMVASVLQALGVHMGEKLGAVLEDVELSQAVEARNLPRLQAIVAQRNTEHPIWGWKRPSAIEYSDVWQSALRNPHIIVVFRDPFAIANRNRISMLTDIFQNMEDSVKQLGALVRFLQKQKCPVLLCSYENVLVSPNDFVRAVDEFLDLNAAERWLDAVKQINPASKEYLEASRITHSLGHLDLVNDRACGGWAFYPKHPSRVARVQINVNGKLAHTVVANLPRIDVKDNRGHPTGLCGFKFEWPADIRPQIGDWVEARVEGDIKLLNGAPKQVVAATDRPRRGALPSFYGIGAQKSGTSWLHNILRGHPQIHLPKGKEVHYWDVYKDRSLQWYKSHFEPGRINGDITPAYAILSAARIADIHAVTPQAKLLLSMRDPIERAWSFVQMEVNWKYKSLPDDLINGEPRGEVLDFVRQRLFHPDCLARCDYATTIRHWRKFFGDNALMLFKYERIVNDPHGLLVDICQHVGADPAWVGSLDLDTIKRPVFASQKIPFPAALRAEFAEYCEPLIDDLEELLGEQFDDWRSHLSRETFGPRATFNAYGHQLTEDEIRSGLHRDFVGGMWEELGRLQLDFMKMEGLLPAHTLLDVGCGPLRGGVRFVEYLDAGHYCGMDINESLIAAGWMEIERAGLQEKKPSLLVDDSFAFQRFDRQFNYAIAQSVFTHLPKKQIIRCLAEVARVLKHDGEFFATFFESPKSAFAGPITHEPGGITTSHYRDPFHYSIDEFEWMAHKAGMTVRYIGDWGHPRGQRMLGFKVAKT